MACVVGAKANVPFVGWQKIELKTVRWKKIKNAEGSAMSVGLLAVYLHYGLCVFGHRSKFISTMRFKFYLSVRWCCVVLPGYNGLRVADVAGFLPLNFVRSTKLSACTKLSAEHEMGDNRQATPQSHWSCCLVKVFRIRGNCFFYTPGLGVQKFV